MSAKLLYSLSDDNRNLQRDVGCMNGFLQFLDRHHLINNRGINNTNMKLLPDNRHRGEKANGTSKRLKGREQIIKEAQGSPIEPCRVSISSSSGLTVLSSLEYQIDTNSETITTDNHSRDCKSNQSHTLSNGTTKMSNKFHMKHIVRESIQTCPSPNRTPKREHDIKQYGSPRYLQPSQLDSPRLAALNESFRSISSNHSAPVMPRRKKDSVDLILLKDAPRLSYDGSESRDSFAASLKVGDLPRLSLDSRQKTINRSTYDSKSHEFLSQLDREKQNSSNIIKKEPETYKPPSSIVAKLMGLQALPESSPSQNCGRLDPLSKSSRTMDENKLDRQLNSPRSNSKDSKTPRSSKAKMEENSETQSPSLTVYGEIQKRLADLDFQKSGKDLRALKQILEAMYKEKNKQETKKENQSPHTSHQSSHINQAQRPQKADLPVKHNVKGLRHQEGTTTTMNTKTAALARDLKKEPVPLIHDVTQPKLHRLKVGQPTKSIAVDPTLESQHKREPERTAHCTMGRYTGERTPRPIKNTRTPQQMNKVNVTNLQKSVEVLRTKGNGRNHALKDNSQCPTIRSGPRNKQQNQKVVAPHPQHYKGRQKSFVLEDIDEQTSEFSIDSANMSPYGNTNSLFCETRLVTQADTVTKCSDQSMKYHNLQQVTETRKPEGTPGDGFFSELTIAIREQPSPVSVLDVNFYGEESPSPVRKKQTAFRDDEIATFGEEWKDIDISYLANGLTPSLTYDSEYQELHNIKHSAQILSKLNSSRSEAINSTEPFQKETNPQTAYVAEILLASGFLGERNYNDTRHHGPLSNQAMNPNLFFELEQMAAHSLLSDDKHRLKATIRPRDRHHRRLIFDAVNDILTHKLSTKGTQCQILPRLAALRNGQPLLEDICKQIEQLQADSRYQSLEYEDDFLTTIIEKDLASRPGNWADINRDTSGLVLDIERLIFRDLIVELVHEEAAHMQAQ